MLVKSDPTPLIRPNFHGPLVVVLTGFHFTLKKDVLDFLRRIRLKEYFYKDEDVDGDFSEIPAFRRKSAWCPDKNGGIFLEAYASALEKKIFEKNPNTKSYRNLTKEEH